MITYLIDYFKNDDGTWSVETDTLYGRNCFNFGTSKKADKYIEKFTKQNDGFLKDYFDMIIKELSNEIKKELNTLSIISKFASVKVLYDVIYYNEPINILRTIKGMTKEEIIYKYLTIPVKKHNDKMNLRKKGLYKLSDIATFKELK